MTKNSAILLSAIVFISTFTSCQKGLDEPTASVSDIAGKWKFISLEAQTNNTQQVSEGGSVLKTVTSSAYTTENNSGYITIDGTKMTSNNISYSINAISKSFIYQDGTLTDTVSLPVQFTAPASSASATYQRIGADSISFQTGSVFMEGATQSTRAGGARIKMEHDRLYLMQSVTESTTDTDQGAISSQTVQGKMVITLQRQ